jgi:periplasmic protein TonB
MTDLDTEQKPSRRLWILAAIGALAIHVGCAALAIAQLKTDDSGDALGAAVFEVSLEMTSPHVEATDLPPGPDTDASVASPALTEQKAVVKETELPKAVPEETEDPDRVVTTNDTKKPEKDEPEKAAVQTSASTESVAAEATARQTLDETAPETEVAKAPNVGIGKDRQKLAAAWGKQISAYFELHKRYPKVHKTRSTTVKVNLALNRQGQVLSVGVQESSGDALFDEAAIAMIRRSDPVPRPPAGLTDDQFNYTLEVNFNDRK